jgi:protease I
MTLQDKNIIVLVEQDYQDMEVWYPVFRLREAGASVKLIGTGSAPEYKGKYGYPCKVDGAAHLVMPAACDGLVIPGGWAPDKLRMVPAVLTLVREINAAKKPIACICHGGWVLVSADIVRNRNVTSYIAIRDDLINAGAHWHDRDVVVDENLVTSRKPDDLPVFMREFIRLFV